MAERDIRKMLLGEILIANGNITEQQLQTALEVFRRSDKLLGEVLVNLGFISEKQLLEALGQQLNMPLIDLHGYPVNLSQLDLVSEEWAVKFNVLILGEEQDHLHVAMSDPLDLETQDTLRFISGKEIEVFSVPNDLLIKAIHNSYDELHQAQKKDDTSEHSEISPTNLLGSILRQAQHSVASAIHIEPYDKSARVRLRIDGMLHEILRLELDDCRNLIAEIKERFGLAHADSGSPQYSRVNMSVGRELVDSRVSILPTHTGDKVVLRITNPEQSPLLLQQLGPSLTDEQFIRELLSSPSGIILFTGPRDNGLTTTLYAALHALNEPDKSILTVEDPVNYPLDGISQIQIGEHAGTNVHELYHVVRNQEPDVMVIDDMHNNDWAPLAVLEATNGRLVLYALHEKCALSAISNIAGLGILPSQLADALRGCISQRLVRKICPHCKTSYPATEAQATLLNIQTGTVLYHGEGCIHCAHSGYLGRTAVFGAFTVDNDIRQAIASGTFGQDDSMSIASNCRSLVLSGMTSIEEYSRIIRTLDLN